MYAPTAGTVTPSPCWARAESRHALASTELPGTGRAAADGLRDFAAWSPVTTRPPMGIRGAIAE